MIQLLIKLLPYKINATANLFTFSYCVLERNEIDLLTELEISNIINENKENISESELLLGNTYQFDLSWTLFRKYGVYTTCSDFVKFHNGTKNKEYYVLEINCTEKDYDNFFIKNYNDLNAIVEFLTSLADDSIQDKLIIYSENKYMKIFKSFDAAILSQENYILEKDLIVRFLEDYGKSSQEIKVIFKNELINFLQDLNDTEKLKYLFGHFSEFYQKCTLGYEYYLSNFSYNKLKIELNNAVSDFHKNIRSVINDSQTKLVAIPASVLLVFTNVDTNEIIQDKNIFIFLASVIFALLMNFFIINQLKALSIIKSNKNSYIELFERKKDSITLSHAIESSTSEINSEIECQRSTLIIINIINWIIPAGLLAYICTYVYYLIQEISF